MVGLLLVGAGVPDFPLPCLWMRKPKPYFSLVEKGSSTQQVVVALIASGLLQAKGIGESGGIPCRDYMDTSTSSSPFFPPPTLLVAFLSPLPFLFHCFFFPSIYWLALGFVDCTLCTSNIWVGGTTELRVWLATICCIDNCCN
jgi:hypothetical protein